MKLRGILISGLFILLIPATARAENYKLPTAGETKALEMSEASKRALEYVQYENSLEAEIEEEDYLAELDEIVQLVAAEAEGEHIRGKRYVVDVILNRVDSETFPDDIHEVIFQPGQFTSISNGRYERAAREITDEDYEAVKHELRKRTNSEILFFTAGGYSKYGEPSFKFGSHYFSTKKELAPDDSAKRASSPTTTRSL